MDTLIWVLLSVFVVVGCLIIMWLAKKCKRNNNLSAHFNYNHHGQKTILLIEIGTFCDFKLIEQIARAANNIRIVYITGSAKRAVELRNMAVVVDAYHVEIPQEVLDDPARYIEPESLWPSELLLITQYTWKMVHTINVANREHNIDCIISHTAGIAYIRLSRANAPTTIIHPAPGSLPNFSLPFNMDKVMINDNDDIWNTDLADRNYKSSMGVYQKMINPMRHIVQNVGFLSSYQHVMLYNSEIVENIQHAIPLKTVEVGLMRANLPSIALPDDVGNWLNMHKLDKKLLFVSFGSYTHHIISRVKNILFELNAFCLKCNTVCIFHASDTTIAEVLNNMMLRSYEETILIYNGFIAYPTIVPMCSLVLFTGSLCLQTECWHANTKMCFAPYLAEQYMWAKIYRKRTHVPFYYTHGEDTMRASLKNVLLEAHETKKLKGIVVKEASTISKEIIQLSLQHTS